ncbi:hypothetical protein BD769DRAFT_1394510 [Suillus cothurnatus]|nr:hypothetical protein BD769DRAFT_1394510 [Suillus cothurnatus]
MARTKQTSKKTTGGPAKCGVLGNSAKTQVTGLHIGIQLLAVKNAKLHASKSSAPKLSVSIPKLPVTELTLKPLTHNEYCFFCWDGGNMYDCFLCPHTGFEHADGTPLLNVPTEIIGHTEMTSHSQLCSNPILMLHFILDSLADPCGSPALAIYNILKLYQSEDKLQYHKIVFDIGTLEKALKHAKTCPGDLITYSVKDFFVGLFVGGIENYARGSTMWMFICGHTIWKLNAFKDLKACIKYIITAYVKRVLIEGLEV